MAGAPTRSSPSSARSLKSQAKLTLGRHRALRGLALALRQCYAGEHKAKSFSTEVPVSQGLATRTGLQPVSAELAAERRAESTITRVNEVLSGFAERDYGHELLTAVRRFPARAAQYAEWPGWVAAALRDVYRSKGVTHPYTHQAAAAEAAHSGKNIVIVTPTASGKTLCYNLPVIHSILENPGTRALYLFPTKALAQDQLAELYDLNQRLEKISSTRGYATDDSSSENAGTF